MLPGGVPIPAETKQALLQDGVVKPGYIPEFNGMDPDERDRLVTRLARHVYEESVTLDLMGAVPDGVRPDPDLMIAAKK